MSEETRERSFDELARGLSSGTLSRRKVLRLMGAALFGGALASIPGVASARPRCTSRYPVTCGTKCCPEEASCVRGRCICPGGDIACPSATVQGSFYCCPEGTRCCSLQRASGVVDSICCPPGTRCGTITDVGGTILTCR